MESEGLKLSNESIARSGEAEMLAREIAKHQEEEKSRSYLSSVIVTLTEQFHGNKRALEHLDGLRYRAMYASLSKDSQAQESVRKDINEAIKQDKDARQSAHAWSSHTSGFIKSLGLFYPGKAGYAVSALASAADSARPEDSATRQSLDAVTGAVKGGALKFSFDKIGQSQMNLALKAGTLSLANRFAEVGLSSHTYFDKNTGKFDPGQGVMRTFNSMTDYHQLGNDLLTFGGAYLAIRRFGITPDLAKTNPVLAQTLTGAGFGFSGGFFSDLQMQKKLGDGFDLQSAVKSALLQMTLDGSAAAIGGARIKQMQSGFAPENQTAKPELKADLQSLKPHVEAVLGLDNRPLARPKQGGSGSDIPKAKDAAATTTLAAQSELARTAIPNFEAGSLSIAKQSQATGVSLTSDGANAKLLSAIEPGSPNKASKQNTGIREFVVKEDVSQLLSRLREQGPNAQAILRVQEILSASQSAQKLGPERTLLIQHIEPGVKPALEKLQSADLLACCRPQLAETLGVKDIGSKHLFPDAAASAVFLQVPGSNRLRFSLPETLKNSPFALEPSLELGAGKQPANNYDAQATKPVTVSEWLRSIDTRHRMSDLHDVALIAKAMDHFKGKVGRYLGGGNETIAFELTNGMVLRVTDKPFNPDWGKRTLKLDNGQEVRFDANMGQRQEVRIGDTTVNYYIQEKGITPVSKTDLALFNRLIDKNQRYVFWDNDMSSWGQSQLAYVPLRKLPDGTLTAIPLSSRANVPNKGLALIDYDAVRIIGQEPKNQNSGSWRFGNYDFDPF